MTAKRGDIYMVSLDPTSGHETQGRRPVLVVSPAAFNKATGDVSVVLPITQGGSFARMSGFAVSLSGAGTATQGVIRCDQPRALDFSSRQANKLERVPQVIMEEVIARLATICM
ncbi:MAG: type II toxin-antitoxin system PemK/MazF family toxin [Magnetococcus sp. DMHC-1]